MTDKEMVGRWLPVVEWYFTGVMGYGKYHSLYSVVDGVIYKHIWTHPQVNAGGAQADRAEDATVFELRMRGPGARDVLTIHVPPGYEVYVDAPNKPFPANLPDHNRGTFASVSKEGGHEAG